MNCLLSYKPSREEQNVTHDRAYYLMHNQAAKYAYHNTWVKLQGMTYFIIADELVGVHITYLLDIFRDLLSNMFTIS